MSETPLYNSPTLHLPSNEKLKEIAEEVGLDISVNEIPQYRDVVAKFLKPVHDVSRLVEPTLPTRYPRLPGYRPQPSENKFNAWYWRTDIQGACKGKLYGKTIAIKDNICVAGVPMMNGSKLVEGYTPHIDATVVTRILDAGGRILGKSVCEDLCLSGGSISSSTGHVPNPHNPKLTAGGSSSGSAVLVAVGDVDMALGGDQGGSIRIPSAWCGTVGLKPTHGLVPYTGAMQWEPTLDHLGPIARNVYDVALMLEVIAGVDEWDPRQPTQLVVPEYTKYLTGEMAGVKIGVLKEGFDDVDDLIQTKVRTALNNMANAGAHVTDVTVPEHKDGTSLVAVIDFFGGYNCTVANAGHPVSVGGYYNNALMTHLQGSMKTKKDDFPRELKAITLAMKYVKDNYGNSFYGKASNLRKWCREKYDEALKGFDVLALPTLAFFATAIPPEDVPVPEYVSLALGMVQNTAVFDMTGHPAISIPCGTHNGQPVGMMLVGKHFDEATVLRIAYAYEQMEKAKK